jgi:hypothetical protein
MKIICPGFAAAAFCVAASSVPLPAADSDFNGRWNLTVQGDPRGRAWWLEVTGAGGKRIEGRFVGAPGGQLDVIPKISVSGRELVWEFEKTYPPKGSRGVYKARIERGRLTGALLVDGVPRAQFTGERAPEIRDQDGPGWKAAKPIAIFNGRDLAGWTLIGGKPVEGWSVRDGLLVNSAGARDLVSTEKFWNFELRAEFRVGPQSNSGIALRDRYEVQIFENAGKPADLHTMGAIYSRIAPSENAQKPAGEWQVMEIRLVGRTVTVKLNGVTVIDRKEIEGFTAMAHDPAEAMPGPISIQGDHGLVEFRQLIVTPLMR